MDIWRQYFGVQGVDHLCQAAACPSVILSQFRILYYNIAHFRLSQAVRQNFGLLLNLLHQSRILVHDFSNFTFKVGPDLLLVLNDKLRLIQLRLKLFNFVSKFLFVNRLLSLIV